MKKVLFTLVFGTTIFLAACGGNDEKATDGELDGEKLVMKSCIVCHGGDLGGQGNTPAIADAGSHYTEEEILNIIENGKGGMPAGVLKGDEAKAAAEWLATQK